MRLSKERKSPQVLSDFSALKKTMWWSISREIGTGSPVVASTMSVSILVMKPLAAGFGTGTWMPCFTS